MKSNIKQLNEFKPFSEIRREWRKEWERSGVKDWYKFLETKINAQQ